MRKVLGEGAQGKQHFWQRKLHAQNRRGDRAGAFDNCQGCRKLKSVNKGGETRHKARAWAMVHAAALPLPALASGPTKAFCLSPEGHEDLWSRV